MRQPGSEQNRRPRGLAWGAAAAIAVGTGVALGVALDNLAIGVAIGLGLAPIFALSMEAARSKGRGPGGDTLRE